MHIPDNYLSPSTCAVLGAVMVPVWSVSIKKAQEEVTKEKMPLLGIGAAFSFLIMMFNIPIPGGTTVHAAGGLLLAILLGPYSACISLTVALFVQAILFGDGGILAFGANCFNLAFIMPFVGYFTYKFIKDRASSKKGEYVAMAIGSYLGLNMAALFTAIEFGIQPLLFKDATGQPIYNPYPLSMSIPPILISHLLVAGVVEAIFTITVFTFIKKVSPGSIYKESKEKIKIIYGLLVALICLSPLGLIAAGTAWGEWGTEKFESTGFIPEGMKSGFSFKAAMPDYTINGLPEVAGYIISAVAGVSIFIILFKVISSIKKEKR